MSDESENVQLPGEPVESDAPLTMCPSCGFDLSAAESKDNTCPDCGACVEQAPPARSFGLWVLRGSLLIPLGVTVYLLWFSLSGNAVPGCGPGQGCAKVLASRWAYWLGVPVSAPAVAVYLGMIAATFAIEPSRTLSARRGGWAILLFLALVEVSVVVWFIGLQIFHLQSICKYCMVAHASGGVIAFLILLATPISRNRSNQEENTAPVILPTAHALMIVLVAIVVTLALITGQMRSVAPPPPQWISQGEDYDTGPGADRYLIILDGLMLRPRDWPMLGSPDAKHIVVYLFDYTCPMCRNTHKHLVRALEIYGDQIGVVCIPAPLSHHCNPVLTKTGEKHEDACDLARAALAVWLGQPDAFTDFENSLLGTGQAPTAAQGNKLALHLLGRGKYRQVLASGVPDAMRTAGAGIYKIASEKLGSKGLPKLIWAGGAQKGGGYMIEHGQFQRLEKAFGIKPLKQGETFSASNPIQPLRLAAVVLAVTLATGLLLVMVKSGRGASVPDPETPSETEIV